MGANNRVNSDDEGTTAGPVDAPAEKPRWWLRNPALGVVSATVLGVATASTTASIEAPDPAPGSTLLYLVVLPIALMLPALAAAGVFIAWRAFQASGGRLRVVLATPAAAAIALNVYAIALFGRWLMQVVTG